MSWLLGAEAALVWNAFRTHLTRIASMGTKTPEDLGLQRGRQEDIRASDVSDMESVRDILPLWDSYLPYAVVFGLRDRWVGRFAKEEASAPDWFLPYESPTHTSTSAVSDEQSLPLDSIKEAFSDMFDSISDSFSFSFSRATERVLQDLEKSAGSGGGAGGGGDAG